MTSVIVVDAPAEGGRSWSAAALGGALAETRGLGLAEDSTSVKRETATSTYLAAHLRDTPNSGPQPEPADATASAAAPFFSLGPSTTSQLLADMVGMPPLATKPDLGGGASAQPMPAATNPTGGEVVPAEFLTSGVQYPCMFPGCTKFVKSLHLIRRHYTTHVKPGLQDTKTKDAILAQCLGNRSPLGKVLHCPWVGCTYDRNGKAMRRLDGKQAKCRPKCGLCVAAHTHT
jgi:hypothetical protein